ncbi:hypothetical protein WN944_027661 [Citrus x changshan-huyou]|uniref:Uncharacterized protein n=1 Tax=Citrus x changshan-huyou TaxID=2935761 RepID=A0AAP0QA30_9ROSI
MHRLETRWFTDVYESGPNTKSFLLELAKLDFIIVHAARQEDRKYVSRLLRLRMKLNLNQVMWEYQPEPTC